MVTPNIQSLRRKCKPLSKLVAEEVEVNTQSYINPLALALVGRKYLSP